jgi:hypothetical protein
MFFDRFQAPQNAEMSSAPFHVVWRVYPHLDLVQMSAMLSGIAMLERRKVISLSVEFMSEVVEGPYAALELVVTERRTGNTRKVVVDFYDRADKILPQALEFSDIYFKRQLGPETRVAARGTHAEKIAPAGLTIAGFSGSALRHVCIAILGSLRASQARRSWDAADLLRRAYAELRLWATSLPPDAARLRDTDVKRRHIVFQPRLWDTVPGSGDDFDVANQERIAIVRALRRVFPDQDDTIGLLHSEIATAMARDLLLRRNVTTGTYYKQLRHSLVAVNCTGLSGSVGWKFGEYLAAGTAVVSQPIEKELLSPVVEGVHYLAYRDPDECAALCHRLVSDNTMSSRMCEANRQYFMEWVNPPAHLMHLFRLAFA